MEDEDGWTEKRNKKHTNSAEVAVERQSAQADFDGTLGVSRRRVRAHL
jgi:hypothetical protein